MTPLPESWLRAGRFGGWLVLAGLVTPVSNDPKSLPILVFWLFPLVLPYWFAGFAALSLGAVSRGRRASRWAALHASITAIGAIMLPIWLHLHKTFGSGAVNQALLVIFVALLPAAVPLLSRRNPTRRLLRAVWLNAAGCLLFAGSLISTIVHEHSRPSLFIIGPVLGLCLIMTSAMVLEFRMPASPGDRPRPHLPNVPRARWLR